MPLPTVYSFRDVTVTMSGGENDPADLTSVAKSIKLPALEREKDAEPRFGAAGAITYISSFKELECEMSLMGYTDSFHTACMRSVNKPISIIVTALGENVRDNSDIASLIITMRGPLIKFPTDISFEAQKVAEINLMMGVNYYRQVFKGATFEYDPDNMIWRVNTQNMWEARKTGLGI